jgi:ATP-dependent Zn protease
VQTVFGPRSRRASRSAAVIIASAALFAAPALAAAPPTTESYQALLGQISGHQVRSATINRKAHIVKVTLDDGSVQRVDYPPAEERTLSDNLRKSGATVKIAKKKKAKKAVHHKLRYIAAGIAGVIVVVGLVLLILRGRRPPEPVHEAQPAPTAPPAQDKPTPPPDAAS